MAWVEVDVDLEKFDDNELINELRSRDYYVSERKFATDLNRIAEDIKLGKDYLPKLRELIYNEAGIIL